MLRLFTLLLVILSGTSIQAAEKIYKWTDELGNVHYSDQPDPAARQPEIITLEPPPNEAQVREAEQMQRELENSAAALSNSRQQREKKQAETEKKSQQQQAEREKLIEEARKKWEMQTDQPVTPWYPAYPGLPRPPNRPGPPLRPRPPVIKPLPGQPR